MNLLQNHNFRLLIACLFSLLLGAFVFYFFISKPKEVEYERKAVELQTKYNMTLKVFAVQDSVLRLAAVQRNKDTKSRDNMTIATISNIATIDSMTRVNIDSNDLKEAKSWLDLISKK